MCGIAGYITKGQSDILQDRLCVVTRQLRHRGPDDSGIAVFHANGMAAGLASTRLSIIDLSAAGHMPMVTADGLCAIVYNGEIYDAPKHREHLESRGVIFRSRTDTEVLLYGLALDGPEFLDRIDGMYAFGFWDSRRDPGLLLGRDRFGEKPLFVADTGEGLVFASELPAILRFLDRVPEVDSYVLWHTLEWGYPPADKTILAGIRKLLPGGWEWHGARSGVGSLAPLAAPPNIARNLPAAAETLRDVLTQSVRDRMIADVPVGVFLSGGIDSAGIASIAAESLPKGERLNTYTVGYPSSKLSELSPARRFAERIGSKHHEILLDDQSLLALPFVAAQLGEPVIDPASLPTYFLSAASKQSSTVVLTGEGADEIFFGYPRYLLHDLVDGIDSPGRSIAGRVLLSRVRHAPADVLQRDKLWKGTQWPVADLLVTEPQGAPVIYRGDLSSAAASRADDLDRWLPASVLVRVDRMTMAASIESRAPYLGRDVARLGLHFPREVCRRFPFGKAVLRSALEPYLPWTKRIGIKRPFAVPLGTWLTGPLRGLFDEVFFGHRLAARGWFKSAGLRSVGAAVLRGEKKAHRIAWGILTLELWARAVLDGETPLLPEHAVSSVRSSPIKKNLVIAWDFPPSVGGIQVYNRELWGYGGVGEVTVVAPQTSGYAAFDSAFPGQVFRLPSPNSRAARIAYLMAVSGSLPRHYLKADVVHVAHVALSPAVLPLLFFSSKPLVVWTYALELTNPRLQWWIRLLMARADRVVVISEYTRRLAEDAGARPDRIVKISAGGDDLQAAYNAPDPARFRRLHGIGQEEFLLLSVGRLSPLNRYKGFDRILEVAALLRLHNRSFRCVVVGNGPDLERYRGQAKDAGLDGIVSFVGHISDEGLADAYAACDLFCLLSREEVTPRGTLAEGYGIVYVQASSFGKPVMGLRRGGVPDAVLHGDTGILIDEDTAESIASQIERLMDDRDECGRLGANGREYALGRASWSTARSKLRAMLEEL